MKSTAIHSLGVLIFICSTYALRSGEVIPNQWIVLLHPNTTDDGVSMHLSSLDLIVSSIEMSPDSPPPPTVQTSTFNFGDQMKGYVARLPPGTGDAHVQALVDGIQSSDQVLHVESDRVVTLSLFDNYDSYDVDEQLWRYYGPWRRLHVMGHYVAQTGAPWNLVRISHRWYSSFLSSIEYIYPRGAGSGSTVYILDTGIDTNHSELSGRAYWGASFVRGRNGSEVIYKDDHSHGTHVAGIVASTRYGVAKQTKVIAVKVMNWQGTGATSVILAGLEWIYNNANMTINNIINTSLRISSSRAVDAVATMLINQKGFVWSSSAGNSASDACTNSPNEVEGVVTVGATDRNDIVASYSNQGRCVDIFAPGSDIKSTIPVSMGGYGIKSGTSMAAPHVSGLLALARTVHPGLSPLELNSYIKKYSTRNVLRNVNASTPNRFIYTVLA
ncbi:hypothetical protein SeMB42_g05466 [Synchytrium endobioticum]|uniref:Peptidase S8/S53 domain-containing protein n=1 Tax=Synchytrium endobioticum TaxID=286115 RepID=A0A507CRJ5_9FUNG|nr:hypothetical protein SeMB42_g05466 [Synchytrium endobioticum]TPX46293.1 hypothetical protein SeLEV6574_g03308 [Synchytrium endobioticum]